MPEKGYFRIRSKSYLAEKNNRPDDKIALYDAICREYGRDLVDAIPNEGATITQAEQWRAILGTCFDGGLARRVACTVKPDGADTNQTISAPPAFVPGRPFFLERVQQQMKSGNKTQIAMLDLAGFVDANFSTDEHNQFDIRPADVMANLTANSIQQTIKEESQKLNLDPDTQQIVFSRYGGDEYALLFVGEFGEKRDAIMKEIETDLAKHKGYYKKNGKIQMRPIELKKNPDGKTAEWIDIPEGKNERMIFERAMQRGSLLDRLQIQRIVQKYTNTDEAFDFARYTADTPDIISRITYPETVQTDGDKIAYLRAHHPFLDCLRYIPEDKTQRALSAIEGLFDPLFNELIFARSVFTQEIKKGNIGEIYSFDFKNAKEINTAMSYADTDTELKRMFQEIQNHISDELRNKIIISRFGNSFYFGIKKGEHLLVDEETETKLKSIKQTTLFDAKGHQFDVPIGYAHIKLHAHEYNDPGNVIRKLETLSENNYYRSLIKDVIDEIQKSPSFIKELMDTDIASLATRSYQTLTKPELYALQLKGKRKNARISHLLESVQTAMIQLQLEYVQQPRDKRPSLYEYLRKRSQTNGMFIAAMQKLQQLIDK